MATTIRFQLRGDSAENWASKNPVLLKNEPAYDQTNNRLKLGDGVHAWNDLDYVAPDVINDLITGGELKALSAEQGRVLAKLIEDTSKDLGENKLDAKNVTHETWIFTLEDESTVEKEVVLWSS